MAIQDTLKALAGAGNESVESGGAIGQKTKMIQEYKDATSPKPPAAPKPVATAPRKSTADGPNPKGYGSKPGEKRFKLGKDGEILGQFKKGGKVKKTGIYKLHKNERVLNAKQTKKMESGGLMTALGGKMAKPSSFKNGGVVEKTGMAKVHAGEVVIPQHITRIIPNPNGVKPLKDTDRAPQNWAVQSIPTQFKKAPVGVPGGDTSNVKRSSILGNPLSMREQ